MPTVTFLPSNTSVEAAVGESLLEVARRNNLPVETACVGQATCGLCRIKIVDGEALLTTLNDAEKKHLGNVYFINKIRLSCQAKLLGEGEVKVLIVSKGK